MPYIPPRSNRPPQSPAPPTPRTELPPLPELAPEKPAAEKRPARLGISRISLSTYEPDVDMVVQSLFGPTN